MNTYPKQKKLLPFDKNLDCLNNEEIGAISDEEKQNSRLKIRSNVGSFRKAILPMKCKNAKFNLSNFF